MRIIILTEAGQNFGFGHLTRCIGLYQGFREKNIDTEIIVNADKTVDFLLRRVRYKKLDWLRCRRSIFSYLKDATIIVIDSYSADLEFYKKVSETVDIPVYIDDYKRLNYPRGIVVNPSIYGDKLKYSNKKDVKYLLGKDYIILRKEFWNVPEKIISKEMKNVLITFGGMDHSPLAKKIVKYFKDKFKFNIYLVDTDKNKLTARKILKYMLKADICISGGGQTTYELARVGVPTIGICFAENQRLNLKSWQDKGFIKYAGWHSSKNLLRNIERSIIKFIPYEERAQCSKKGKCYLDGKGAERIVNKILSLC